MTLSSLLTDAGGVAAVGGRALTLGASAAVVGACVFRWAVVLPVARRGIIIGNLERGIATTGLFAALALALDGPARIVVQAESFVSQGDPLMPMVARVLATTWGLAAVVQLVAALVAAIGFAGARAIRHWGWPMAAGAAVGIIAAPAWMGHAAATERWTWLAVATDITHMAAAGGWAGGVLILALVIRGLRQQADGGRVASELIAQFRVPALASGAILLGTGAVSALFRLNAPADLYSSTYGLLLVLKLAVVAVAATMGRKHSQTAAAQAASGGARSVSRSITIESMVLLAVLLVTALLSGSPPPGTE
jgi:putative copper export protein